MTTISIDDIRKCLSEQFYSYNRDDHSILISLLNLPEQLKQWNKCDTDQPIDELIKEVKSCLKKSRLKILAKNPWEHFSKAINKSSTVERLSILVNIEEKNKKVRSNKFIL